MKMHIRMTLDPVVPFGFMGSQIVHNHMDFFIRMVRNNLVHKIQKLSAAATLVMARFHLSRGYIQGCEKRTRSMPSVLMIGSRQRLTVGQSKPPLSPFQCLNGWLLIHAYHHRILRRIQVKANNISRLTREFRIRRDTPTTPSLKVNSTLAQHRPYLVIWDTRPLSQKPPVPLSVPFFGGGSSSLRRIVRSFSGVYLGGWPLRGSSSKPSKPSLTKRLRHLLIRATRVLSLLAISTFVCPSAPQRMI